MNLQGDFEGLTLASILQLLCNDQKTGILAVTRKDEESRVFFDQGTIVYASASLKQARLGFLMRTDGVISAQQLQKCLSAAREEKVHLGKVLVEKGYISLDILKRYNTKQVETILYDLLFWEKGKFEYKDARLNLKNMIVTQLNPMRLILEASRRIDELSVLKKVIPSDKMVFKMSGKVQSKEEIKLNANEWRVLSLIDGSRSVRQVITESGYDEFAVYKIFFSVISSGLIEQKEEIPLNNGDDGNGLTAIVTVFTDVLLSIRKNIAHELGERVNSLFLESKSDLGASVKKLFENFDLESTKDLNLQAIETSLKTMDEIQNRKALVISGFAEYIEKVLKRVGSILGTKPLLKALKDIEKVLEYVQKYQTGSTEKDKIVTEMNAVIDTLRSQFTAGKGKSKKGIFSLFS
ncbi:conserved hypothetical protein [Desulforapulum autotrophicum HRM2]|uniref:PatA-like N-terminal domain-containing protein n=1 Tax=Desulforapulum autotrophicum (strain ATCC 43914 / DSM 3382 / VKM B-1955 / HRM2) TaxID=177437 RepID=C0Q9B3_DESAH|nr:DUF4388 domain-containing protein [Desulforapulum autotrophicum]ACN16618.1 conserved hypothetical protein [Desulforapulum autotrophicum HRM2]